MARIQRDQRDDNGQQGQEGLSDQQDPRLERVGELAEAALFALRRDGHTRGCSCNLCQAARMLLAALGQLASAEVRTLAELMREALWPGQPGQLKLPLASTKDNEGIQQIVDGGETHKGTK